MKTDVLTFAALVFFIGLLMSTISVSDIFETEEDQALALQQEQTN